MSTDKKEGRMPVDNSENTVQTHAGAFIINPGSGSIPDATLAQAYTNIQQFVADLGLADVQILRSPSGDSRGRYEFLLWRRNAHHQVRGAFVHMPGCGPDQVRFTRDPDQNVMDFYRLYVDDASWLWCFALDMAGAALRPEEEEGYGQDA